MLQLKDLPPMEREGNGSLYRMDAKQRREAVRLIRAHCSFYDIGTEKGKRAAPTICGKYSSGDQTGVSRAAEGAVCQSSPAIAIFSRKEVHLGGRKKLTNNTDIPQHQIEAIARCILPDILAFYESEEGQREFSEWKKQREIEKQEAKTE